MIYASIHFKTCPIEIRENWNLSANPSIINAVIHKVTNRSIEFVNISTCNRFDICFFDKVTENELFEIFQNLSSIKQESFAKYLHIYHNNNALRHLFRVTASLDSLVLGEQQIFGQIKSAYAQCVELGFARKKAQQIFSQNFRVAKKIRTETEIGKNSVSIGHAAISMIHQVFDALEDKKVLVIGAGDMAKISAKNFLSNGVKSLYLANRTFEKAEQLALDLGLIPLNQNRFITPLQLSIALEQLHEFDICIVAAGGNDFLITKDVLKKFNKKRQGDLTVYIDISVPRKITPEANNIDNLFLFCIDDLDKVMEQNRTIRAKSALKAEQIIEQELLSYSTACEQKENLANIAKMHQWIKKTIQYEVDHYHYNLSKGKNIDSTIIAGAITKKIISHAAYLSRTNKKLGGSAVSVGEMLEFLFKLSTQEELEFTKNKVLENVIPLKKKKATY